MTVRTRVAPSPTGDPHVGTAYIALFNLCYARQHGGQFILRIEDTDQSRSTDASEQAILDSLRWLGLNWDEGPDVGGPHGPYRQSERATIYREHAERLLADGHAFKCFRTAEELDELRAALKEAGENRALKPEDLELDAGEQARREEQGAPYVIRMRVPKDGRCPVEDQLRGTVELDWALVDAQILLKSDGMPTYHLANVVDDHLMGITHVIRGEEWLNSAPKHKLLYQYFGWDMPVLCHMPLLRNPDKSKLSKRKNPTSINFYRRMGYLPEAVVNYLGRMGWSMPDERERFTLDEMQAAFDIQRVSLGGPVFDVEKLSWLNGQWLRDLSDEQFLQQLVDWAFNRDYAMKVLPHVKQRVETFGEVVDKAGFCFAGQVSIGEADFEHPKYDTDTQKRWLQFFLWACEAQRDWTRDRLFADAKILADAMEVKIKDFLFPVFVAVAGTSASFSVVDSMELLGSDVSRARLRHAIEVLGGVSKKQTKKLEKEFGSLFQQTG
ncbi:glutamate--tRNA ligase [Alloalcanivorax profundimaris]|uniref:Glutamate--tRNA ligase n=1 Tax=Alloalcanivorax profundimaris TaxID=2735259 RepID=A0ABS0AP40_9GAMM|nr:glutamate--tRNA ligase [Alloalcanivorax profundimaris]MAO57809.1 glutamate--tRNA ligase [Alcanivorax sp.]MBM1145657.1 glutamate--tRNA ligase [Alcanivorax sp. ZXX171]UWN52025.1 Glutamate--tRNA ligase [Alcanivorax sp. ALC70]MAY11894.1 glutamate--tRNA ligase [Alcanivorax sp.]MBF1801584.1 glutamate--tRNA ligase [Alloalcanivorax profundimaris]|tara:strand:- start:162 stop:1652 length:1491 start_codon:yes stop_codon:yes gene_type:complete